MNAATKFVSLDPSGYVHVDVQCGGCRSTRKYLLPIFGLDPNKGVFVVKCDRCHQDLTMEEVKIPTTQLLVVLRDLAGGRSLKPWVYQSLRGYL